MTIARRLRFEVLRRDNHTCRYCGAKAPDVELQVDHVIPEVLGGSSEPANLVTACTSCNQGKASIPADASVVEDVAKDALRWKLAMEKAAQLWKSERAYFDAAADEFKAHWDTWTYPTTRIVEGETPDDPVTDPFHLAWRRALASSYFWGLQRNARPVEIADGTLVVQIRPGERKDVRQVIGTKRALSAFSDAFGVRVTGYRVADGFTGPIPDAPRPTSRTVTERHKIPLDNAWRDSIERFLNNGLDIETLQRSTDKAMAAKASDTWRYFCGICWNTISDLQEDARRIVESEV